MNQSDFIEYCLNARQYGKTTLIMADMIAEADRINNRNRVPLIKNVIFNDPATIVFWVDGTKTVVKCQEGDIYDPEKGMAMAICKKALGNQGNYCEVFKKWLPDETEKSNRFWQDLDRIAKHADKTIAAFKELGDKLKDEAEKKKSSDNDLRCTVCKRLRLSQEFGHYCTVDGRVIDPAKHACSYFEHEIATCDDCSRCYAVAVNEEGSCIEFRCDLIDEKSINRTEPACWRFDANK